MYDGTAVPGTSMYRAVSYIMRVYTAAAVSQCCFTCKLGVQGDEMGRPDGFTYYLERGLEVFLGDVHGTEPVSRSAVGVRD